MRVAFIVVACLLVAVFIQPQAAHAKARSELIGVDVPQRVLSAAKRHVRSYLGTSLAHCLRIQSVYFDTERNQYDFHCTLDVPLLGIARYRTSMSISSDGTLLSKLALPEAGSQPQCVPIVSLTCAKEIASRHGYVDGDPYTDSSVYYRKESGTLHWQLENFMDGNGFTWERVRVFDVDMSTGCVVVYIGHHYR